MQYAQERERRSTQSIRDGAESKGDEAAAQLTLSALSVSSALFRVTASVTVAT